MKILKIKTKKISAFLARIPRILGEKAFFTFLGGLIVVLSLGGFIFYKYNILIKKIEPPAPEKPLIFEQKTYEEIIKVWQEKEKKLESIESKSYPNPFD